MVSTVKCNRIEIGSFAAFDHRPVQPLILVDIELEHLGRLEMAAPTSSMLTVARLEIPNQVLKRSATAATARSPCQWKQRCKRSWRQHQAACRSACPSR
jgi:hypothetical protein